MLSSEAVSSNGFVLSNPTITLKSNTPAAGDGDFSKGRETGGGSDFFHVHGLARYRSSPSSFLAALLESNADNNSSSGDESEAFFSALIDAPLDLNQKNTDHHHHHHHNHHHQQQHRVNYSMKQEIGAETDTGPEFFTNGHTGGYVGSYSMGMENQVLSSLSDNGNSSNLVRHSSSPAGLFNEFVVMGEVGGNRVQNHAAAAAASSDSGLRNHQLNFSAGLYSGSRFMPHLKRNQDGGPKMFSGFNVLEIPKGESRKKSSGLGSHSHTTLPKGSSEMAAADNYLHFRPEMTAAVVPCQIRAKRGCATHPRSIAERMRRTRISDNMKKLQHLFPNMDKQINTADMLDLAVEYIKDLEKQVNTLNERKAKCVCSHKSRQKGSIE